MNIFYLEFHATGVRFTIKEGTKFVANGNILAAPTAQSQKPVTDFLDRIKSSQPPSVVRYAGSHPEVHAEWTALADTSSEAKAMKKKAAKL